MAFSIRPGTRKYIVNGLPEKDPMRQGITKPFTVGRIELCGDGCRYVAGMNVVMSEYVVFNLSNGEQRMVVSEDNICLILQEQQ